MKRGRKTGPHGANPLTPEQASAVLKADLANLIKRTKEGKPLSSTQRAMVAALADGQDGAPSFAHSIVELSAALGCSRRTITRYLRRDGNPGSRADGRYDVTAWRTFLRQFGALDEDAEPESEELDGSDPHLRGKLMAVKIEMAKLELARMRGELVSVESVRQLGAELGGAIRKTLTVHRLASSLVGLSVGEIEDRLKEAEDETLLQLHMIHDRINAWSRGDDEPATVASDAVAPAP